MFSTQTQKKLSNVARCGESAGQIGILRGGGGGGKGVGSWCGTVVRAGGGCVPTYRVELLKGQEKAGGDSELRRLEGDASSKKTTRRTGERAAYGRLLVLP